MTHIGKVIQKRLRRGLRCRNEAPRAPFTAMAFDKARIRQVRHAFDKAIVGIVFDILVDMKNHRTARRRPMPRNFLGPVKGRVNQHDDANAHRKAALITLTPSSL